MCRETAEQSAAETDTHPDETDSRDNQRPAAGDREAEVEELRFELLRSALYHDDREQALAWRDRAAAFITIVFGSGVVIALLGSIEEGAIGAALLTVLINSATLVYDFSGAARDHRDLKRRYYELLADTQAPHPDLAAIRRHMILAYADERPTHRALNALAHNQAGDLIWGPGKFRRLQVSFFARLTRHLLPWRTASFSHDRTKTEG